jgi:Flp pilus assembly protein TadG
VKPSRQRRQGGQALVEFALVAIVLLVFFFAIIDGARAVYAYQTIGESSRAGGHMAQLVGASDAQVRAAVNEHSGMLGDVGAGATISPATRVAGGFVTVTVTYKYSPITPLLSGFGPVNMTSKTTVVVE